MTGTTNLNLTKPTVGGDSDAWGGELNTDLDTLDSHLQGILYGLTLSAAGSTATFGIAAGAASGMALASAYTKTTGAWTLGTGNGALDTGVIANTSTYHVWLIQRSDTGVVDVLVSLSASSPTMPSNYDRKRRIGSMKTDGSAQWVGFTQMGDEFLLLQPLKDAASVSAGTTNAILVALSVPNGLKLIALFDLRLDYVSNPFFCRVTSPDQTDIAASSSAYSLVGSSTSTPVFSSRSERTSAAREIRLRFDQTDPTYTIFLRGWIDRRGRD